MRFKAGRGGGAGGHGENPGIAIATGPSGIAATYLYGIGKGLREPCPPYPQLYIFGSELNPPFFFPGNCLPEIIDPTTAFDLSIITPYHEVVIAFIGCPDLPSGTYTTRFRWYRDRDNALLFEYAVPDYWPWYVYSYIGYVPWEIYENGGYHVDITLVGNGENFFRRLNFTVSGVAVAGTISKMELEYDESRANIPAYNIEVGNDGLVHAWGRNDSDHAVKLGISWQVTNSHSVVVESYSDVQSFTTSPGSTHEFIGGRFPLNYEGTWYILVYLWEGEPFLGELLATYDGTLCTVVPAVPEPEFSGFGITEYQTV